MRHFAALLSCLALACSAEVGGPSPGSTTDTAERVGDRNPFIVGGQHSTAFAATGSLFANGRHFCTGTLLTPDRVLTAAHCLEDVPPQAVSQIEFVLGNDLFGSNKRARARQLWLHPSYVPKKYYLGYDIALVALATPIHGVRPVALYPGSPQQLMGRQLTLVGYGRSENDPSQGIRRQTTVILDQVTPHKISYRFEGKGACYGDSGGPAFVQVNNGWWQVGITSHGTQGTADCQERAYYARIDVYAGWLAQHGLGSGDRPRQCQGGNGCDGLCPADPDCSFLFSGGGASPGPPPPDPPPPPPGQPPPFRQGYGGPCLADAHCLSNFCAAHPHGGGYCSWACDAQHPCPPGGRCFPTQYPELFICGPLGW